MCPLIIHQRARLFAFHNSNQRDDTQLDRKLKPPPGHLSNGVNDMTMDPLGENVKGMNYFLSQFNSSCVHKVNVVLCLDKQSMTKENLTHILTYVDHMLVKRSLPTGCQSSSNESNRMRVNIQIISEFPGITAAENEVKLESSADGSVRGGDGGAPAPAPAPAPAHTHTCMEFSRTQYAEVTVAHTTPGDYLKRYLINQPVNTLSYENFLFFVDTRDESKKGANENELAHCVVLDALNNSVFAFTGKGDSKSEGSVSQIRRYTRVGKLPT
tara:strand:- start:214 stop:1023 length:810 start_codon:yes stop_codon:yes gene_type:complete